MYLTILKILIIFIINFVILKLSIPFFKKFVIDIPSERSTHITPTPRGGGIIFSSLTSLFCAINGFYLPILNLPLSIIGFVDDIMSLPSLIRYLAQLLTAIISLKFYCNLTSIYQFNDLTFWIAVFIFTSIINFINFMDGIDGFVTINFLVFLCPTSLFLKPELVPLIICLVVFLSFNWHPARIFMGDAGSTFLGSIFACLIFSTESINSAFYLYLVFFPFFADAITCILRRILLKENIFTPHKLHLYQRLYQNGFKNNQVIILYSLPTLMLTLLWINKRYMSELLFCLCIFIIGYLFDKYFAKSIKSVTANE